jgi:hypothetical protein
VRLAAARWNVARLGAVIVGQGGRKAMIGCTMHQMDGDATVGAPSPNSQIGAP